MLSDMQTIVLPPSARDGETESDSAVIVAARLPEIVKQMLDVGGRDAGTGVGDVNRHVIAVGGRTYRHGSMLRRECANAEDSVDARLPGQHFSRVRGA